MDDLLSMDFATTQQVQTQADPLDPFATNLSGVMDVLNTMGSSNPVDDVVDLASMFGGPQPQSSMEPQPVYEPEPEPVYEPEPEPAPQPQPMGKIHSFIHSLEKLLTHSFT